MSNWEHFSFVSKSWNQLSSGQVKQSKSFEKIIKENKKFKTKRKYLGQNWWWSYEKSRIPSLWTIVINMSSKFQGWIIRSVKSDIFTASLYHFFQGCVDFFVSKDLQLNCKTLLSLST